MKFKETPEEQFKLSGMRSRLGRLTNGARVATPNQGGRLLKRPDNVSGTPDPLVPC